MKVAFYAPMKPPFHPVPSGDRTIAADLWRSFRARGHDCLLLSEFRSREFYLSPSGVVSAAGHFAAAARRAARFRPDLFFTYHLYYKAPDPIGAVLSAVHRKPYVVYEGSHAEKRRSQWSTAPGFYLARWGLRRAAHVFSNMREDLPGLGSVLPAERISYSPPSVDSVLFRPDARARVRWRSARGIGDSELLVACTAMLRADRKAESVRFLIAALGRLAASGLRPRFVLAGGGACFEDVAALARRTLGDAALLLGAASREEVADALRASDLFAYPGLDEGFGLVYLEAQASGLAVVAFRDGGVPDAVADGRTGLLTRPRDLPEYAGALARVLGDAGLRRAMGVAARARMLERHYPGKNYGAVVEACEALAGRRAALARGRATPPSCEAAPAPSR